MMKCTLVIHREGGLSLFGLLLQEGLHQSLDAVGIYETGGLQETEAGALFALDESVQLYSFLSFLLTYSPQ